MGRGSARPVFPLHAGPLPRLPQQFPAYSGRYLFSKLAHAGARMIENGLPVSWNRTSWARLQYSGFRCLFQKYDATCMPALGSSPMGSMRCSCIVQAVQPLSHTYLSILLSTNLSVQLFVHLSMCMHTCIYIYIYIFVCMYICAHNFRPYLML